VLASGVVVAVGVTVDDAVVVAVVVVAVVVVAVVVVGRFVTVVIAGPRG
jgi:hypothetical protein